MKFKEHIGRLIKKNIVLLAALVGLYAVCFTSPLVAQEVEDPFPLYPIIEPNFNFWKAVYSQYDSNKGVIHDTSDLRVVYEVIDLTPAEERLAGRKNKALITRAKHKYSSILQKLSVDLTADTEEEARVLALFGENVDRRTLREARNNIRFQRGQQDRFKEGLVRSGAFLKKIREIFAAESLPEDLCYLPHVESSFNHQAYSKFGAAGIWQFTHGTGKQFMEIEYAVDERLDPVRSSIAAAKLLKSNYEKLGSWPLAITAYNHGANSMVRAQKAHGGYEEIVNEYEGRRFKFASKNFYSEFLAAREVAKNYEKYFGQLQLDAPWNTYEFKLPGFMAAETICRHFQMDLSTLQKLNPALRKPVLIGQKYIPKNYEIRLPIQSENETLVTTLTSTMFEERQKRSRFYSVRRGDVAIGIARMNGITLDQLLAANNLDRRAKIYAGQNLSIPGPEDHPTLIAKIEKEQSSTAQPSAQEKTEAKSGQTQAEVIDQVVALNAVNSDDEDLNEDLPYITTTTDASETKPEIVASSNGTGNGEVKPEIVPVSNGTENGEVKPEINPAVLTGNLQIKEVFQKEGVTYGIIFVEPRETLGHYADWLKITTQRIREINGFDFNRGINYRDKVIIPLVTLTQEEFEEKRFEFHKKYEEDFLSAYKIERVRTYQIKKGDSIWRLCQEEFALPFWLLKKYNAEVDFTQLKTGQKLIVPVVEKRQ